MASMFVVADEPRVENLYTSRWLDGRCRANAKQLSIPFTQTTWILNDECQMRTYKPDDNNCHVKTWQNQQVFTDMALASPDTLG